MIKAATHGHTRAYNLTSGLNSSNKDDWNAHVDLLQGFEFPHFAQSLFRTQDGSYLFAAGEYPPRIKCFNVNEMSLMYSFNADMSIQGGVSLSSDFRRFALWGAGREVTVHLNAKILVRIRVPHTQRCITYDTRRAELLSGGTSTHLHRLSLETGSFIEPYEIESPVNAVVVAPSCGLILSATQQGQVNVHDHRSPSLAGSVSLGAPGTAITGELSGTVFAAGTSEGEVMLFDLRSRKPLLVKDHLSSRPIVKIHFQQTEPGVETAVLSADAAGLRAWNRRDGSNIAAIDASSTLFDFCVFKAQHNLVNPFSSSDSGLVCLACDTSRLPVWYLPALGPAPSWCAFIDNLIEEYDDQGNTVIYEDYRFVTRDEMSRLGISEENVAEGKVRPAMHGAFVENRLHQELLTIVKPLEAHRAEQEAKRQKQSRLTSQRISSFKRLGAMHPSTKVEESGSAKPLLTSATDNALELVHRDPRFSKKMREPAFSTDQLSQNVETERRAAAIRAAQRDRSSYRPVPKHSKESVKMFEATDATELTATAGEMRHKHRAQRDAGLTLRQRLLKRRKH